MITCTVCKYIDVKHLDYKWYILRRATLMAERPGRQYEFWRKTTNSLFIVFCNFVSLWSYVIAIAAPPTFSIPLCVQLAQPVCLMIRSCLPASILQHMSETTGGILPCLFYSSTDFQRVQTFLLLSLPAHQTQFVCVLVVPVFFYDFQSRF